MGRIIIFFAILVSLGCTPKFTPHIQTKEEKSLIFQTFGHADDRMIKSEKYVSAFSYIFPVGSIESENDKIRKFLWALESKIGLCFVVHIQKARQKELEIRLKFYAKTKKFNTDDTLSSRDEVEFVNCMLAELNKNIFASPVLEKPVAVNIRIEPTKFKFVD